MAVRVVNNKEYAQNFGDLQWQVPAGIGNYIDIPLSEAEASVDLRTAITNGEVYLDTSVMTDEERAAMGEPTGLISEVSGLGAGADTTIQHNLGEQFPLVKASKAVANPPYADLWKSAVEGTDYELTYVDTNNVNIKNLTGGSLDFMVIIQQVNA